MNPYPDRNSILVCDNAKIHKGHRIQKICEEAGILIRYLPPYCPELNPIELCFASIKNRLRRTQSLVETLEPDWDIRETVTDVITAPFCHKIYRHCGYAVPQASLLG
jgi:transposase